MIEIKIPSDSMIPSLVIGDHVFVDKMRYGGSGPPERGNVIVFKFPENPAQDFVKRVIALSGDMLEVVNGRPPTRRPVPHPIAMWRPGGARAAQALPDELRRVRSLRRRGGSPRVQTTTRTPPCTLSAPPAVRPSTLATWLDDLRFDQGPYSLMRVVARHRLWQKARTRERLGLP